MKTQDISFDPRSVFWGGHAGLLSLVKLGQGISGEINLSLRILNGVCAVLFLLLLLLLFLSLIKLHGMTGWGSYGLFPTPLKKLMKDCAL